MKQTTCKPEDCPHYPIPEGLTVLDNSARKDQIMYWWIKQCNKITADAITEHNSKVQCQEEKRKLLIANKERECQTQ